MNKDIMEDAPFLDMKPGLNGIDYPANYMHAPKSQFPKKYNHANDMSVHGDAIGILMGK